jgi:hypothetical protein
MAELEAGELTKRRFVAVLHTARINAPLAAVRGAIGAERRMER